MSENVMSGNIRWEAGEPGPGLPSGPGRAAQWGLASLVTGGLVLLSAPLTLIVNILLAAFGPQRMGMGSTEITLATWGLAIGLILMLLLALAGVLFAILGIASGRDRGQLVGLAVAGLLVSAVGLLLFCFVAVDTAFVLTWFNRDPFR